MTTTAEKFPELFIDGVFQHQAANGVINHIAGNNPVDMNDLEVAVPVFEKQLGQISEEFKEFMKGLMGDDPIEIRDGLSDVIVTCDGMFHRMGLKYSGVAPGSEVPFANADFGVMPLIASWLTTMSSGNYLSFVKEQKNSTAHGPFAGFTGLEKFQEIIGIFRRTSLYFGVDADVDQLTVFESNLSKFDTSRAQAEISAQRYRDMGVKVDIFPSTYGGIDYYVVKSTEHQTVGEVTYQNGKFLKSVNYHKPKWTPLPESSILNTLKK